MNSSPHKNSIRVLLLEADRRASRGLTRALRQTGLKLEILLVSTRADFLAQLRKPDARKTSASTPTPSTPGDSSLPASTQALSRRFDLVIAAYGVPGFPAARIVDLVRNLAPTTPLIFAAGEVSEAAALAAIRAGAADYLSLAELDRLPIVVERALREGEADRRVVQLEQELARTAALLRENQKLATMGRLTASIAHEINNPIASIMNLLFLLRDEPVSAEGRQFLNLASIELERVVQITRQTLTFYRETPAPIPVRPQDLLDDVVGLFSQKARNAQVSISREYETQDSITVFPGEMRQVFANLVANAIDATAPGGRIRLRVRTVSSWSEPGIRGVRITIADTGAGIPEHLLHRIGDAFYTTKGQSGTGLGLWVASGIVLKYGGVLHISTSTNPLRHGTVFNIFLPANLRPGRLPATDPARQSPDVEPVEQIAVEGPGAQSNIHEMPHRDVSETGSVQRARATDPDHDTLEIASGQD
jgi:two-component system NtrC family sensor kinase